MSLNGVPFIIFTSIVILSLSICGKNTKRITPVLTNPNVKRISPINMARVIYLKSTKI